jgi:hypothetical protein
MVETGKIRVSINREERAVDELFYKIGEAVYDNCMRNGVTPDYIASECKEVEERRVKIAKLNAKLSMARAATEDMDSKKGKQEKEVIIDITVDDKKEKTE